MSETTVVILAGGLSTRMGQDKSFVSLDGQPLLAHVIRRLRALSLPIIILANQPDAYRDFGLPVFTDVMPERSSLVGIYSAIHHSPTEYILCVACDMPFLNPTLLGSLVDQRAGYDAVVPLIGEHPQGVHAVYRKTCLPIIRQRIEQHQLRIRDIFPQLNTCWVHEETLRRYDPHLESFINVNTPEALQLAVTKLTNSANQKT